MKIVDEYNSDFIELKLLEVLPNNFSTSGDRNISIQVQSHSFTGRQTVWLDYNLIQKFVAQINAIEESRKGEAQISSISPDEFLLHIGFYDTLGHVYFEGYIAKRFKNKISKIAFYLCPDASMLRQYVCELTSLLTSQNY